MAYKVLVSAPAEAPLDDAVDYIATRLHAPLAAASLLDAFEEAIRDVASNPLAHGIVEEYRAAAGFNVRRRLVKRYELDYYVDESEQTVYVVAFLHGLQNGLDRLLDGMG